MELFAVGLSMSVLPEAAMAQNQTVKGTVSDDGGPIIGATIRVKGSSKAAAVTDFDGNFSVSVPKGSVLEISYLAIRLRR